MRALFSDLKSQKISIHWLLKVVALQLRLAHLKTLLQQVCNISRASHQANLNNIILQNLPLFCNYAKDYKAKQAHNKIFLPLFLAISYVFASP